MSSAIEFACAAEQDRTPPSSRTLQRQASGYSTADTFASAASRSYHTHDADHSGVGSSRANSIRDTIQAPAAAVKDESKSPSTDTARQQQTAGPVNNTAPTFNEKMASSDAASSPQQTSNVSDDDAAETEEAGQQIEPTRDESFHRRAARHLATVSLISFAAIWGTLARKGLSALNTYDGQSVTPLVWAQTVGCLVMGLAIGGTNQKTIESRYAPAYVMITTGFCGSVTTFSAWVLDVFRAFGDQMHYNRHGLHNVMDALTQTAVTLGMSLVAVAAGMALAKVLSIEQAIQWTSDKTASQSKPRQRSQSTLVVDSSMILLGAAFWAGSAILCGLYAPFRAVTFGIVMAPPGAVLRWYLSRLNSRPISNRWGVPFGTLAANLLATAVICAAFTSSRVGSTRASFSGGVTGCQALLGLQDGFCGCLSTISTFAVELRTIKPIRKAVRYAVISWIAGLVLCVLLMGAPWWAIGMDGRCLGLAA